MSKYYFVGSGIASLAGAAYLIRDGKVDGSDIVLFEESPQFGGALDAHGDAAIGYFMSGSRMFESKYNCTFELLSSIPSGSNPVISVTEETNLVRAENTWNAKARLVNLQGETTDAHPLAGIATVTIVPSSPDPPVSCAASKNLVESSRDGRQASCGKRRLC